MLWLETFLKDVHYGFRQLRRSPVLSLVAVLSLAMGIGANTAIFTLINAVMLQTLPVRDPGRLVLFYDGISTGVYSGNGFHGDIFSYASWEYLRDHNESFEGLSAFRQGRDPLIMHIIGAVNPRERTWGHLVSGNYFTVLGVQPALGRMLTPEDDNLAASSVAVISYDFWSRRFALDHSVIGKAMSLNGAQFTIVGVAPPEFFGEQVGKSPDFWLPLTRQAQILQRESWLAAKDVYWLNLIGRLKPGVTMQRAQATLNTQLQQFYAEQAGMHITADQRRQMRNAHIELKAGGRGISWMRFMYSEPLHVLMAVVALVLLIACANVATLLLARAAARQQEMFTRLALGASRTRLVRQLLTESVLLALLGGVAGVALAWWSVQGLVAMMGIPSLIKIRPDLLVLSFTLGISILTGIGFGLFPALRSIGMARSPGFGMSRFNPTHAFVVLQVASSSVLLVGAGLLTHNLFGLEHQDLGYSREHLLLIRTDPRLAGYQPAELFSLYRRIQDRLNTLPGVASACIARFSPLSGYNSSNSLSIEGYTPSAGKEMRVSGVEVGPRFFETLKVPLLQGRPISPRDTPASPAVAVVSESFVREFFPGQNPLGRHFSLERPFRGPGYEIVGVVADSKYYKIDEKAKPMAYFSAWQSGGEHAYVGELVIRTSGDPSGATAEVKALLHEIDSRLPILRVTTLSAQVHDSLRQDRMITTFCTFFGLLGLSLAAIGLYGTMSYAVARRTKEIGVRMALGAQRPAVLWRVLRESVALIAIGLIFGLPLALGATRWIKSFLFGISTIDPVGIGAAVVLLGVVATLAGYLPARRATKVDPMVALRHE